MAQFKLDIEKSIHATLLVLNKLGGTTDFHKVFKILYFADQKHLAKFGRPVTGDDYVAMKHGPVPSNIYGLLKAIKGGSFFHEVEEQYAGYFDVKFHFVTAKINSDLDLLSETDIECLSEAIAENKDLNFFQLTDKSHDDAYENSVKDDLISLFDIAKVGGANEDMLKYIRLNIENQRVLSL
jgi:uncharacterized phage-associated protein